jgi:hypothetical protein
MVQPNPGVNASVCLRDATLKHYGSLNDPLRQRALHRTQHRTANGMLPLKEAAKTLKPEVPFDTATSLFRFTRRARITP